MTDIPIIFSAPMIRALLDARKTMTRRLAWRSETDTKKMSFYCDGEKPDPRSRPAKGVGVQMAGAYWLRPSPWQDVKPGDRLWVRENFAIRDCGSAVGVSEAHWPNGFPVSRLQYIATNSAPSTNKDGSPYWWNQRPCIHMPRWASRITLIVTETKIERLQDISHDDAVREGVSGDGGPGQTGAFMTLWEELHGPDAWKANPEVVAIGFTFHPQNIDTMPKAKAA